jgi:hypothetical protein
MVTAPDDGRHQPILPVQSIESTSGITAGGVSVIMPESIDKNSAFAERVRLSQVQDEYARADHF